jgi:DNA invertase Pin-like site-specific DNA recombinase
MAMLSTYTLPNSTTGESMKAAIYARSATKFELEKQVAQLTAFANDNALTIKAIYTDEGRSGLDASRPGYQAMLTSVRSSERNWNALLVKDVSRLSRDQATLFETLETCHRRSCAVYLEELGLRNSVDRTLLTHPLLSRIGDRSRSGQRYRRR